MDYSGLGQSTSEASYNPGSLAKDAIELIHALGLGRVVIGGWSLGGIAAQIVLAEAPQLVSHTVLLGTTPLGQLVKTGEPLFYELARRGVEQRLNSPGRDWRPEHKIVGRRCPLPGLRSNSVMRPRTLCSP